MNATELCQMHYVDGAWTKALSSDIYQHPNPAHPDQTVAVAMGSETDAERAVAAARAAFPVWSQSTLAQRRALLAQILKVYERRMDELALAVSLDMGAPLEQLAKTAQVATGLAHLEQGVAMAARFTPEERKDGYLLRREPIGVCALITPWNWPINQMMCKLVPVLLSGCVCVLKPSELAPRTAAVLMDILHEAGVPAGVVNLVHGAGESVGAALSRHPHVDMVSLTGSGRAGAAVSANAASSIKRVSLELGGKSANIVVAEESFDEAVSFGVQRMMRNSGQSCNAPSRMLVSEEHYHRAQQLAVEAAQAMTVGDPVDAASELGPLANERQFSKVAAMIRAAVEEGAAVLCGGPERPDHLSEGFYLAPTVLADVKPDMTIAKEEVFGPVLCLMSYRNVDEAIDIANDSDFGLSGYVSADTDEEAVAIATQLRTGMVHINGAGPCFSAPFGGYKQSGLGREWGEFGLDEFTELKAILLPSEPA